MRPHVSAIVMMLSNVLKQSTDCLKWHSERILKILHFVVHSPKVITNLISTWFTKIICTFFRIQPLWTNERGVAFIWQRSCSITYNSEVKWKSIQGGWQFSTLYGSLIRWFCRSSNSKNELARGITNSLSIQSMLTVIATEVWGGTTLTIFYWGHLSTQPLITLLELIS